MGCRGLDKFDAANMRTNSTITILLVMTVILSVLPGRGYAEDRPAALPLGFRFIGNYQLSSKLRVEKGVSTAVVISPLYYRVYSDGIDVRVYCRSLDEENYIAYEIYRSDGIGVVRKSGEIDLVAGVQANSIKGGVIRQVSVTRNSLTMVNMPPRSHRVIITRAVAVSKTPAISSVKTSRGRPKLQAVRIEQAD